MNFWAQLDGGDAAAGFVDPISRLSASTNPLSCRFMRLPVLGGEIKCRLWKSAAMPSLPCPTPATVSNFFAHQRRSTPPPIMSSDGFVDKVGTTKPFLPGAARCESGAALASNRLPANRSLLGSAGKSRFFKSITQSNSHLSTVAWTGMIFDMPSIEWNRAFWTDYDWPASGEEWSSEWGDAKTQWWTTIMPRISRGVPAGRIVEIAPGRGRWTRFLLDCCQSYAGYDISADCLDFCRKRFDDSISTARAQFFQTDGGSLSHEKPETVDFVFSFDSLVHAESGVMDEYLAECLRVLSPGGLAFLHHSNLAALDEDTRKRGFDGHSRGITVSAETVRNRCDALGILVLVQETVSWKQVPLMDCFSLVAKPPIAGFEAPAIFANTDFWNDIARMRRNIGPYLSR